MRNAKMDLAKRQAVGIDRPVARFAKVAVGSFRVTEGAKDIYHQGRATPVDVSGLVVTLCKDGVAKGSGYLQHKSSQATPQARSRMSSYMGDLRPVSIAYPKWVPAGISTLIPRAR